MALNEAFVASVKLLESNYDVHISKKQDDSRRELINANTGRNTGITTLMATIAIEKTQEFIQNAENECETLQDLSDANDFEESVKLLLNASKNLLSHNIYHSSGPRGFQTAEEILANFIDNELEDEIRNRLLVARGKRKEQLGGCKDSFWSVFNESYLYPPLFNIAPEKSFPDAWEVFCCDILNRHYKTDLIYRREPPDNGVDLYWQENKIAYQCKSVQEATGRFNLNNAKESLYHALKIQNDLGWEKYFLCSNISLTGSQETELRKIFKDIEFLTPSFWIPRCKEQKEYLTNRFNRIISMSGK